MTAGASALRRHAAARGVRRMLVPALGLAGLVACGQEPRGVPYEELETIRRLGLSYLEEERSREAAAQFARLGRLAPDEPLGPANLAIAHLRRGDPAAAREPARRAVDIAPAVPQVRLIAATVAEAVGDRAAAVAHLEAALAADSTHVPTLWALHRMTGEVVYLERLLELSSGNLPARLTAVEARLEARDLDRAVSHLETVEQLLPPGSSEAKVELRQAVDAILVGAEGGDALRHVRILHNLLRVDPLYARGLAEVGDPSGARPEPLRRFLRHTPPSRPAPEDPLAIEFVPIRDLAKGWASAVAVDVDADGAEELVVVDETGIRCRAAATTSSVESRCAPGIAGVRRLAQAADFDGDTRPDLLAIGPRGIRILFAESGGFRTGDEGAVGDAADFALAADLDHDGDLDVLAGSAGPSRLYRQTTAGRFEEVGREAGVAAVTGARAGSFGDLDVDGDLDLVLGTDAGVFVLENRRHGRFEATLLVELSAATPAIADLDGDGRFDLLLGTPDGLFVAMSEAGGLGPVRPVFQDSRGGTPEAGTAGPGEPAESPASDGPQMLVEDLDLDGRLDVVFARAGHPARAFRGRGDGRFIESPSVFETASSAPSGPLILFDADGDGDLDLASGESSRPRLFRNRGGERNHVLEVSLLALADGSGKVNRLGIGSRLDVWVGGRRQSRVVRGAVERFGLGEHARADVVRIEWTNGVPQNVFDPRAAERLVERQVLKGSCAFLYAWTGERFEFVTDMMWKSALGMPLGIMAGEVSYAPPEPSLEYVRLPSGLPAEREGRYEIRITEELWEVAYLDALELLAVDHPADVDVYVDEAFGLPTVPNQRLYAVRSPRPPEAAVDDRGRPLDAELAARDFQFVGGLDRDAYQGVTRPHHLVLTLTGAAGRPTRLFLGGWVHPTDASINVRMGQGGEKRIVRPRLEVPDGHGGWRDLGAAIDFPSGKNKTVVVELAEGLPAEDPRLRIRTNMEIYWDVAFYTAADVGGPFPSRRLRPLEAELRERGFSRQFRRGGRYGPHWFDYDDVRVESPWRPLPGAYTREGSVRELLQRPDDRYVVFGPGDEIAVSFTALAPPASGWTRTFFLYSDGFLKDADLNTLSGDEVRPLPRHGQAAYPPAMTPDEPDREFVNEYMTRIVPAGRPPSRPPHSR